MSNHKFPLQLVHLQVQDEPFSSSPSAPKAGIKEPGSPRAGDDLGDRAI